MSAFAHLAAGGSTYEVRRAGAGDVVGTLQVTFIPGLARRGAHIEAVLGSTASHEGFKLRLADGRRRPRPGRPKRRSMSSTTSTGFDLDAFCAR